MVSPFGEPAGILLRISQFTIRIHRGQEGVTPSSQSLEYLASSGRFSCKKVRSDLTKTTFANLEVSTYFRLGICPVSQVSKTATFNHSS